MSANDKSNTTAETIKTQTINRERRGVLIRISAYGLVSAVVEVIAFTSILLASDGILMSDVCTLSNQVKISGGVEETLGCELNWGAIILLNTVTFLGIFLLVTVTCEFLRGLILVFGDLVKARSSTRPIEVQN